MNEAPQSSEPERPGAPVPDEAQSAAGVAVGVGDERAGATAEDASMSSLLTHKSTQGGRFRVAYVILATLATLAVVAFAVLLVRGGPADTPLWSTFEPTAEGLGVAEEVAAFVESRYVFEDGTPMVSVSADWLTLQGAPIEFVSIERPDSNGRTDELLLPVTSSVKFGLCGDGEQCSITRGVASPERLRYLSRASLELALHTFQYMPEVESVVTYLPPPVGTQPTWALFFQRADFAWALDAPLSDVMELTPPETPALMVPAEATLIDELTTPIQFRYTFLETADAETVLGLASDVPG